MIRFIKTAALGLPLCAIAALAQPALAAETPAASKGEVASVQKADAKAAKAKKICIRVAQDTGTRMSRQQCRTRDEWEQLEVEIPAEK